MHFPRIPARLCLVDSNFSRLFLACQTRSTLVDSNSCRYSVSVLMESQYRAQLNRSNMKLSQFSIGMQISDFLPSAQPALEFVQKYLSNTYLIFHDRISCFQYYHYPHDSFEVTESFLMSKLQKSWWHDDTLRTIEPLRAIKQHFEFCKCIKNHVWLAQGG